MKDPEKILSDYIDDLNAEHEPEKRREAADNPELEKLVAAARLVSTLREPLLPDPEYPHRIANAVADKIP